MSSASPSFLTGMRQVKVKFSDSSPPGSAHALWFGPHRVSDPCPEKPNLRTLRLINVPPWCSPDAIRRMFDTNGAIENIFFQVS